MMHWTEQLKDLVALRAVDAISEEEFQTERNLIMASRVAGSNAKLSVNTSVLDNGSVFGQYKIVKLLGQGGMGQVYKVEHKDKVFGEVMGYRALKLILPELNANLEYRERIRQEAIKGMKFEDPNIARVYDLIETHGRTGFIMEYIEGRSLREFKRLSLIEALRLLKPLFYVLDKLHQAGFIHRDVKPDNIRIHQTRGPILLDFGIAKEMGLELTETTKMMGTPIYMSPEQMDAKSVNPASDQYSLGMIIYRILSGKFPWRQGTSPSRIIVKKLAGELIPLSDHNLQNIPKGVSEVISRALSNEWEERYESCHHFFRALSACLSKDEESLIRDMRVEYTKIKDMAQVDQTQVEMTQTDKTQADKTQTDKTQADKTQTDKTQTDKTQTDKTQTDKTQAEELFGATEWREEWRGEEYVQTVDGSRGGEDASGVVTKSNEGELLIELIDSNRHPQKMEGHTKKIEGYTKKMERKRFIVSKGLITLGVSLCLGGYFLGSIFKHDQRQIEWVKIPAGSFMMGSNDSSTEQPIHEVRLKSFLISKTEVTVEQYRRCVEAKKSSAPDHDVHCNWSRADRGDHPMNCVDWSQSREFAQWIGADLCSESQWEYSARAGEDFIYAGSNNPNEVAWYTRNAGNSTHPVAQKKKNSWGLYDMSGNVYERTLDEYQDSYLGAPQDGSAVCSKPKCVQNSSWRVKRGGSWSNDVEGLRVTFRRYDAGLQTVSVGIRLCKDNVLTRRYNHSAH